MPFKHLLTLVCAATLLAAAGCSSAETGGAPSSTTSVKQGVGAAPSVATTTSNPVRATLDPETWKSDVIVKISRDVNGGDAGGSSGRSTMSDDGRFVAFDSSAADLVPDDTNRGTPALPGHTGSDIFVFDRQTSVTERVSVAGDGTQADGDSDMAFISGTGRWVAFHSSADNLVPGDTNECADIFLRDRQTGTTELVSVGLDGGMADGGSYVRGVTADGRFVLFSSSAGNLVLGDTNEASDVFVRDRQMGTTQRVSVGQGGKQGNKDSNDSAISEDGRFVAFQSEAANLLPGDTNKGADMFVRDRQMGTTERVSVSSSGVGGNNDCWDCSISADGRLVAFTSAATNLVKGDTSSQRNDVFVYDRETKTIERISVSPNGKEGNNSSGSPSLSADGRYVAFLSFARNLVSAPDTNRWPDAFVRDLETGKTWRVSLSAEGVQADEGIPYVTMSGDGRWVAFTTQATNLVSEKIRMDDVFVTRAQR